MVSGKGILITVIAATISAVIAGTVFTKEERGEFLKKMKDSLKKMPGIRTGATEPSTAGQTPVGPS